MTLIIRRMVHAMRPSGCDGVLSLLLTRRCYTGKWTLDGNTSEVWPAHADADAWRGEPSVAAVYPACKPLTAPEMRDAVGAALRVLARDPAAREDPLPGDMVAEQQLMDWAQVRRVPRAGQPGAPCTAKQQSLYEESI